MKTIIPLFLTLLTISFFGSCRKEEPTIPTSEIKVAMKNTDTYRHDFQISGDEEGAMIKTQALYFQASELIRDSSTNWNVVYEYKPLANYIGTDLIEIETCTGGQGLSCSNIEITRISFTIND